MTTTSSWISLLAIATVSLGINPVEAIFNCKPQYDGHSFNLNDLSGLHKISYSHKTPPSLTNTTWYINPCQELDLSKLPENTCPKGSQICGVQTVTIPKDDVTVISQIIPVAGDFDGNQSGSSSSKIDGNNGVHVEFTGGKWGDYDGLKAQIDFYCVDEKSDDKDKLEFISWDDHSLKLKWSSPKACPLKEDGGNNDKDKGGNDDKDKDKGGNGDKDKGGDGDKNKGGDNNDDDSSGNSWGWFTWLFIVLVLGFSAYVVASAWINYNRYGLSGVELLPHSDAVRDVPYLVRDFAKKIANTFAGGTSRGGYSAV